jgi:hypothetical protein
MRVKDTAVPAFIFITLPTPAYAKSIGEALSDMGLQESDPRGLILMVVCVALLVTLASTLIFTTLKLGAHHKKNPKNGS